MQTNPQQTSVSITLRWMTNDSNAQVGRWEREEHHEWQACFFGAREGVGVGGLFSGGRGSSSASSIHACIYHVPQIIQEISELLSRKRNVPGAEFCLNARDPFNIINLCASTYCLCVLHTAMAQPTVSAYSTRLFNCWSISHRLEKKTSLRTVIISDISPSVCILG